MIRLSPLALAAALAANIAASPLELRDVPAGARLLPGTRVVAVWPRGFGGDEAELLLSLDGGRTFPLRLTAEFRTGTTSGAFRIPNLPSGHAVIALRSGIEGGAEAIQSVSAPVAIENVPGSPLELLVSRGAELFTREAAQDAPAPRSDLDPAAPGMAALGDPLDASEATAAIAALPPATSTPASRAVSRFAAVRPAAGRAAICDPKRE